MSSEVQYRFEIVGGGHEYVRNIKHPSDIVKVQDRLGFDALMERSYAWEVIVPRIAASIQTAIDVKCIMSETDEYNQLPITKADAISAGCCPAGVYDFVLRFFPEHKNNSNATITVKTLYDLMSWLETVSHNLSSNTNYVWQVLAKVLNKHRQCLDEYTIEYFASYENAEKRREDIAEMVDDYNEHTIEIYFDDIESFYREYAEENTDAQEPFWGLFSEDNEPYSEFCKKLHPEEQYRYHIPTDDYENILHMFGLRDDIELPDDFLFALWDALQWDPEAITCYVETNIYRGGDYLTLASYPEHEIEEQLDIETIIRDIGDSLIDSDGEVLSEQLAKATILNWVEEQNKFCFHVFRKILSMIISLDIAYEFRLSDDVDLLRSIVHEVITEHDQNLLADHDGEYSIDLYQKLWASFIRTENPESEE